MKQLLPSEAKILILGSSGFLGSEFKKFSDSSNLSFFGRHKDLFKLEFIHNQKLKIYKIKGGFKDALVKSIELSEATTMINCIAKISAESCENDPESAYYINSEIPNLLSEISNNMNVHLIHISTDAVFGQVGRNFKSTENPFPVSIYGKSKLKGEAHVLNDNLNNLVVRTNFYGYSSDKITLFNYFYNNLKKNQNVEGFVNQVFSPLFINDLVRNLILFAEKKSGGLIHFGGSEVFSKYYFGVQIAKALNINQNLIIPLEYMQAPNGPYRNLDISLDSTPILTKIDKISTLSEGIAVILKDIGGN